MCSGVQIWICSCAELVNGGYAHVNSFSMVDMLICSSGQWRDMLMCSCGQCNGGYNHMQ